jgi:hypothetical protein
MLTCEYSSFCYGVFVVAFKSFPSSTNEPNTVQVLIERPFTVSQTSHPIVIKARYTCTLDLGESLISVLQRVVLHSPNRYSCPTTCMIWPISMALLDGIS